MAKINLMDSALFNRISAGEVIVRPLSVVKECVENSIDSGASSIKIYISNEGKDIRVIDNGSGMDREDAQNAFLPHATSKINCIDDLDNIATLGFRGEALASIASVAMITLNTIDEESGVSTKVEIKDGKIQDVSDSSIAEGTDIYVQNLFYNTPVRAKFLKSVRAEQSEITNLVTRLILANPYIEFSYYIEGEEKYCFDGSGLKKATYQVYGKEALENSILINGMKNGITLNGYIGKTTFTKANRSYQTLILNGRYIINDTIATAVYKAYEPYLMRRAFPFFILHMDVPTEIVDVNAHPTKNDVRFSDNQLIFKSIYAIISEILSGDLRGLSRDSFDSYKIEDPIPSNTESVIPPQIRTEVDFIPTKSMSYVEVENDNDTQIASVEDKEFDRSGKRYSTFSTHGKSYSQKELEQKDGVVYSNYINKEYPNRNNNYYLLHDNEKDINKRPSFSDFKTLGVFNDTYIIAECNDTLYLIDQHAAHERFLFDKYVVNYHNQRIAIQDLLVPYVFTINESEENFMKEHISDLVILGFRLERFGERTFKLTSIPLVLVNVNFDNFFRDIFSDLNRLSKIDGIELVRNELMQKACKNAIKAGDSLKAEEVEYVFKLLEITENLTCPHGRPILTAFTKKDVEKMFKRLL